MFEKWLRPGIRRILTLKDQNNPGAFWGSAEMWWLLLALALVVSMAFLWAVYIRKPKRRSKSVSDSGPLLRDPRDRKKSSRGKKWRRRNPTLAETGGLPPPRSGNNPSAPS